MLKNKRPSFEKPILMMVVDDSEIFRKQIIQTVKLMGVPFKVFEAPDVPTAKKAIEQYTFDIIMCDLNMPGESGIDFVAYAKGVKKIKSPILMITSESGVETILEAIEKGATDYLIKPWNEEDFATKFYACFGSHVHEDASEDTTMRNIQNSQIQKEELDRQAPELEASKAEQNPVVENKQVKKEEKKATRPLNIPDTASVLVLEDSPQFMFAIKKTLSDLGFKGTILEAGKTADALEVIKTKHIDLALVDWNLPDMPGIELIKTVKSSGKFEKLIMIMLTAESDVSKMLDAIDLGADDYVVKPIENDSFKEKLNLSWDKYHKKKFSK